MNKKWKELLKSSFEAPKPKGKQAFLLSLDHPKMTNREFLLAQMRYIRKRVWICSGGLLLCILYGSFSSNYSLTNIRFVSALMPIIALLVITELIKSMSYKMEELEMSCRYSLTKVIISRFLLIGGFHLAAFFVTIAIMAGNMKLSFYQILFSLMLPYLATCAVCLFVMNHIKIKETTFLCGAIAVIISMIQLVSPELRDLWENIDNKELAMFAMFLVLFIVIAKEIRLFIKRSEELPWSLT